MAVRKQAILLRASQLLKAAPVWANLRVEDSLVGKEVDHREGLVGLKVGGIKVTLAGKGGRKKEGA